MRLKFFTKAHHSVMKNVGEHEARLLDPLVRSPTGEHPAEMCLKAEPHPLVALLIKKAVGYDLEKRGAAGEDVAALQAQSASAGVWPKARSVTLHTAAPCTSSSKTPYPTVASVTGPRSKRQ